jgi:hypothetical protein
VAVNEIAARSPEVLLPLRRRRLLLLWLLPLPRWLLRLPRWLLRLPRLLLLRRRALRRRAQWARVGRAQL